jgi:hypothetical protein
VLAVGALIALLIPRRRARATVEELPEAAVTVEAAAA